MLQRELNTIVFIPLKKAILIIIRRVLWSIQNCPVVTDRSTINSPKIVNHLQIYPIFHNHCHCHNHTLNSTVSCDHLKSLCHWSQQCRSPNNRKPQCKQQKRSAFKSHVTPLSALIFRRYFFSFLWIKFLNNFNDILRNLLEVNGEMCFLPFCILKFYGVFKKERSFPWGFGVI